MKIGKSYFIQFRTVRASVAIPFKTVPVAYSTPRAVPQDINNIKVVSKMKGFKMLGCRAPIPELGHLNF